MTYILSFPFPKILNAGIHSLTLSHILCFVELQENYHLNFVSRIIAIGSFLFCCSSSWIAQLLYICGWFWLVRIFDSILYLQVKLQTWINVRKGDEYVWVSACFVTLVVSKEEAANRSCLVLAGPYDRCTPLRENALIFLYYTWIPLLLVIIVDKRMCSLNKFFLFKHGMYDLIYYLNGEASLVHRGNSQEKTRLSVV